MTRSAPCRRQPATAPRPTIPAPKTTQVDPGVDLGGEHRRAEAGRQAAREEAGAVERGLRRDLGQGDLGHDGRLGEGGGPHEVADRLAAAREARRPVGEVAAVLLLADGEAEVRPRVAAVLALAALGREEGDDVVARPRATSRPRPRPRRPRRPRGRARSARSPTGRRRRRCRGRCGRRRRRPGGRAPRPGPARRGRRSCTTSGAPNSSSTAARICMAADPTRARRRRGARGPTGRAAPRSPPSAAARARRPRPAGDAARPGRPRPHGRRAAADRRRGPP